MPVRRSPHVSPTEPETVEDSETDAAGTDPAHAGESDLGDAESGADPLVGPDAAAEGASASKGVYEPDLVTAFAMSDISEEELAAGGLASGGVLGMTDVIIAEAVETEHPLTGVDRNWGGGAGGQVDPAEQLGGLPGGTAADTSPSGTDGAGSASGDAGSGEDAASGDAPSAAEASRPDSPDRSGTSGDAGSSPPGAGSAPSAESPADASAAPPGRPPPRPAADRPSASDSPPRDERPDAAQRAPASDNAPSDSPADRQAPSFPGSSPAARPGASLPPPFVPRRPPAPGTRRVFAEPAGAERVSRGSIRRMARSTLAEVTGVPLAVVPDDDERAAAEPAGAAELGSLQHVLGLTPFDQPADPALESELQAELGVHGIQVEEFQECLAGMLDTRQREQAMYAVQVRFRSVLDSIDQLSRLTTGRVRYRHERFTADVQQVVRVLLALRVASERLEESVRSAEQTVHQARADAAAIGRFTTDAQTRLTAMHKLASTVESIWQQLQEQQAAAAPERAALVWAAVAAGVGAGAVVLALSLLGY